MFEIVSPTTLDHTTEGNTVTEHLVALEYRDHKPKRDRRREAQGRPAPQVGRTTLWTATVLL
jgi:hypothetical protein